MKTWEDVIAAEHQKKKWRPRLVMLQPLKQPFTTDQLAELWGISVEATRHKLTDWEKKHPWFLYRNTFQKNHLITFHWGTEITFQAPQSVPEAEVEIQEVIVHSPADSIHKFLEDLEETEKILEVPEEVVEVLPPFLKERAYTETIKKLEGLKAITPESKVTFERLNWKEREQRGRLKITVATGRDKLVMTGLYDNGFPISALIQVE